MSAASKVSLPSVTIKDIALKPTPVFDAFWYWVAERKAIDDRRRAGEPAPWTDDPILQNNYFCNPYRVLDKVCQYMIKQVIEKGSQKPEEVVFRILLFNTFTKIETWELLEERLGPLKWSTYDRQKYEEVLFDADTTLYTGAFIKPAPDFCCGKNFQNHLALIENMMENDIAFKLLGAPTMADVYEYLVAFPSMGEFNTYQLILNLSYSNILNFHPNDFVMAGIGSYSGLVKMFGAGMRSALAENKDFAIDVMRWLAETQDEHFNRLGITLSRLGPKKLPLGLADIEHSVCEVDKYARAAYPKVKGTSDRKHLKRKYDAFKTTTVYPAKPFLPKAWNHPARATPRIRPGKLYLEKRYEIRKIDGHRTNEEDTREFLVFWTGYSDKLAEWLPEYSLKQDAPLILNEYLASLGDEDGPVPEPEPNAKAKTQAR
ncbi:hypothetical protein FA13DRAFT_1641311 [Coprinellus micaceus]|uniref:Chromo domain-containing protein n=1 Tax=Coprinellus micaceus TaxID=71717 RepID=A0A4Y7SKR9_COPMI|nr:hypothetical protein FA13DRAFT_1641311 [Coprinellus micaceus]